MTDLQAFVTEVARIGVDRKPSNIERRLIKVFEEVGELSEAWLNVTCPVNYKQKTLADIREESLDCLIVLLDVALTPMTTTSSLGGLAVSLIGRGEEDSGNLDTVPKNIQGIAKNTSNALTAFRHKNDMGFYGALSKAMVSASRIVFSNFETSEDDPSVERLIQIKLGKWKNFLAVKEAQNEAA